MHRHDGVRPERARRLPPLLDPIIARFIEEGGRLRRLVVHYGSPLNIVWPHTVLPNVDAMRSALAAHAIDHEIFYGAKVNKSQAIVRAAVAAGVGIDVSSLAEFEDAVRAGTETSRICATGPAKTVSFHQALVSAGSLISVDSLEELADLAACVDEAQQAARILLRYRPDSEMRSRFGMSREAIVEGLRRLVGNDARFAFEGFHIHLGSYAVEGRVAAMHEIVALVDVAKSLGHVVHTIDIGGGMPIRYVPPDVYAAVLRGQQPGDYRNAKVPAAFYPYGSEQTIGEWISAFLEAPLRGDTVAAYLQGEGIRLAIEPGRSLVDQSAVTAFRVTRVKPLDDGTGVIFVEGSSFSACETWCHSEFLIDPICVPASPRIPGSGALRAYLAGHSCLDDDVVTNRLVDFPTAPQQGDLLVYANTAGYQMDLLENEFHRHRMPTRLIAAAASNGDFIFVPDK